MWPLFGHFGSDAQPKAGRALRLAGGTPSPVGGDQRPAGSALQPAGDDQLGTLFLKERRKCGMTESGSCAKRKK
jgi:hypothetical protein